MKKERIFLGLSSLLFVVLGAVVLFASSAAAVPPGSVLDAPQQLAPRQPTPTPAPLPPGYTQPESDGVGAEALYPDLVIKSIVVEPSTPYVFNKAVIKITIANEGQAPVAYDNNFYVDLYIGGPGQPGSGERGLICQSGNCGYPSASFAIVDTVLPYGCQGFWVGGIGAQYVITANVVFSATKSYYIYAQIDTPEEDYPVGYVYEDPNGGEYNNIYPTGGQQVVAQTKAPGRFSVSKHNDWFNNYASSLEVFPTTKVLTDINGVQIQSNALLQLGAWEEPPICWGTTQTVPSAYCPDYAIDYNVLEPDTIMNTNTTRNQSKAVVATDGLTGSQDVVVVWEDQRNSMENPDIYLRWSDREIDVDGELHFRQDWRGEIKVNDNIGSSEQRNPAAAVSPAGDVVVVWQDNRRDPGNPGFWDIYLQQYYFNSPNLVTVGSNQLISTTICPGAVETFPDVAVDDAGMFYVVWQSECTQQSSIWASKGQPSSPGVPIVWDPGRYVVDPSGNERLNPKVDIAYTEVISDLYVDITVVPPYYWYTTKKLPVLAVTWHEDRGTGTGEDVYVTYNMDQMATNFAEDGRLNQDNATQWYNRIQDQPVIAVSQTKADMTVNVRDNGGGLVEVQLENIPVPALQFAWRDYRNSTGGYSGGGGLGFVGNDPDIYYAYAPFKLEEETHRLFLPIDEYGLVEVAKEIKVNLHDTWSSGWQDYPKQLDPAITAWTHPDYLDDERDIPYEVYVVWADGRNYNDRNYDIYMWHYGDLSDGLRNYMLNDDAKIHDFDRAYFEDYAPDRPPAAIQLRPSIASNTQGTLRLVWSDNRISSLGADVNDVYFTRTRSEYQDYGPKGGIGSRWVGAYLSRAFDSCPDLDIGDPDCDTKWFKIDYGGVTPQSAWVALQTRFGDTITDVLTAEWYPDNLVWAPENAYWIPIRGYLGPGSDIVGPGGTWPQARYAQFRVNMWSIGTTPVLYYVSLFHGRASAQGTYGDVYLPVIFKSYP